MNVDTTIPPCACFMEDLIYDPFCLKDMGHRLLAVTDDCPDREK